MPTAAAAQRDVGALSYEAFAARDAVDAILPQPSPDDICYLQYSSGSTRFPHGVAVTEDGSAIVSHAFGDRVSRVDLATGERSSRKLRRRERFEEMSVDSIDRVGTQAFSLVPLGDGDFALPTVMVDPGDTRAIASMAYYGGSAEIPIAVPLVARVDGERGRIFTSSNNPAAGRPRPIRR